MHEDAIEDNRAWVKALLIACPMGEPLDDCPGRDLRTPPIKKRIIAVDAMSSEQMESIIVHHKQCLRKREGR